MAHGKDTQRCGPQVSRDHLGPKASVEEQVQLTDGDADLTADSLDFDKVQPALAGFVLANERLRHSEPSRKLDLPEACAQTRLAQKGAHKHPLSSVAVTTRHGTSLAGSTGVSQSGILSLNRLRYKVGRSGLPRITDIDFDDGLPPFARRLRRARVKAGLTQSSLGVLLGVSQNAVAEWERDACLPRASLLPNLAAILAVSLDHLFGLPERGETN